jgi:hypothetical protein
MFSCACQKGRPFRRFLRFPLPRCCHSTDFASHTTTLVHTILILRTLALFMVHRLDARRVEAGARQGAREGER